MTTSWRPNFRFNAYASWVIFGLGVIGGGMGIVNRDLQWFIGGGVLAGIGLLLPRLSGPAKLGSPHLAVLEGDVAPVGDPPEEEEVTVVAPEPDDPQQPEESPPRPQ